MEYVKLDKLEGGESHALVLDDDELAIVTVLLGSVIGTPINSWRAHTDRMYNAIQGNMDADTYLKYEKYILLTTGEIKALSEPKT